MANRRSSRFTYTVTLTNVQRAIFNYVAAVHTYDGFPGYPPDRAEAAMDSLAQCREEMELAVASPEMVGRVNMCFRRILDVVQAHHRYIFSLPSGNPYMDIQVVSIKLTRLALFGLEVIRDIAVTYSYIFRDLIDPVTGTYSTTLPELGSDTRHEFTLAYHYFQPAENKKWLGPRTDVQAEHASPAENRCGGVILGLFQLIKSIPNDYGCPLRYYKLIELEELEMFVDYATRALYILHLMVRRYTIRIDVNNFPLAFLAAFAFVAKTLDDDLGTMLFPCVISMIPSKTTAYNSKDLRSIMADIEGEFLRAMRIIGPVDSLQLIHVYDQMHDPYSAADQSDQDVNLKLYYNRLVRAHLVDFDAHARAENS